MATNILGVSARDMLAAFQRGDDDPTELAAGAAAGVRPKHSMVNEQVDARLGDHCRQLLQELARLEADRARPVTPRAPQAEQHPAVRRPLIMMGVNYGFDRVRFVSPVKVNSRIRLQRSLVDVQVKSPNQVQLTHECTVEIEGETKPGCVARWLTMLMYA